MYHFIWNFKYYIAAAIGALFLICLHQLSETQIYFDSERIINELEVNQADINLVDDNNLVFLGVSFNDSLSYKHFLSVSNFHKELKKSPYVNRVFSIINDKKIINTGLFPIIKQRLNLKTEARFEESLKQLQLEKSNFLSSDMKHVLFLLESEKELDLEQNNEFIESLYNTYIHPDQKEVFVAGRSPSESYFQKKVVVEFISITIISGLLCFLFLYLITKNIFLVLLTVSSVIMSIVVSLGISQMLFGGIELIMIITPAILFIVCISDIMHLSNKQEKTISSKKTFFLDRMDKVGKAVALTSITTGMSFLTFLLNDILPILRFGIITSIGVLFTLLVALVVYAISIDKSFHYTKPIALFSTIIDRLVSYFSRTKKSKLFHVLVALFIVGGFFAAGNIQIDNYLTDEINKKSKIYKQTNYFDENFGGIKPLTIVVEQNPNNEDLSTMEQDLIDLGFVVDLSTYNNQLPLEKIGFSEELKNKTMFVCRTKDEGSLQTMSKLKRLEEQYYEKNIRFSYTGAGYLFDMLGNDLTKKLIYGLLIAIFSIGLVFFLLNKFDVNYFIIAIVPNIIPIVVCLGLLYPFNFYFSLSNAFIFTIVFGLIIDDSIHVISSYSKQRAQGASKQKAIQLVLSQTGSAVIKTTFIVLICLLPLSISEFKSVSQLSIITITSAVVAVFFDLIYLPRIIMKLTK